jgi:hypothetical protein
MKKILIFIALAQIAQLHSWSMTFINKTGLTIQVIAAFEAQTFSCGGISGANVLPSQRVAGNMREILPGKTDTITSMDCCFQKVFITTLNVPATTRPPFDLDFRPDVTRCADSVWQVVIDKGFLTLVRQGPY